MSKLAIGLFVAGIAAMPFVDMPFVDLGDRPVKVALAYSEVAAPIGQDRMVYVVTSNSGATCRIVSNLDQGDAISVAAEPSCGVVYAGLDRVTGWEPRARGQDALVDAIGKTILVVSPSDGFAYEAVSENGEQISFALSDV